MYFKQGRANEWRRRRPRQEAVYDSRQSQKKADAQKEIRKSMKDRCK